LILFRVCTLFGFNFAEESTEKPAAIANPLTIGAFHTLLKLSSIDFRQTPTDASKAVYQKPAFRARSG
jgi:hypothetical protein